MIIHNNFILIHKHRYLQFLLRYCLSLFILLVMTGAGQKCLAHADQETYVRGKVVTDSGNPLPGASVRVDGTTKGTSTNNEGNFELSLAPGSYTLHITAVGYEAYTQQVIASSQSQPVQIVLKESSLSLNEIVVLGSRSSVARTNIDRPVPVDVIQSTEIKGYAQNDVTQVLNYVAPSFSSNRQTVSDGTDHIDPASLRGLGPDQMLVLVNGKRRHTSALVNINGTFGRGTVGTDMNAIPVAAIERIEVLRDGAAAQYGSDAIAGAINIVLKKDAPLTVSTSYGQNVSHALGKDFRDGKNFQFDLSKGFRLGNKGSVHVAGQYLQRGASNRDGADTRPLLYRGLPPKQNGESESDFVARYTALKATDDALAEEAGLSRNTMRVGNSESKNTGAFINGQYALSPNAEVYLTTGYSNRAGKAAGFYRLPSQGAQVDLTLYPDGFLPLINTTIIDFSTIAGVRGMLGKWHYDASNTYGQNSIAFDITNTMNASLEAGTSPREFYAGKLMFMQNTFNVDFARKLDFDNSGPLTSLNMGYGAEFRLDNYQIQAGEELSWSFGIPSQNKDGLAGKIAGAQVFPGFKPVNEVNELRNNKGIYADFEGEFGPRVLIGAAGRFEDYSDFGSNLSYKFTTRVKVYKEFAIRGAVATGFRAPSLHQRYFNNESTQFPPGTSGTPFQVLTVNNDSDIVRRFGVGALKPEISKSYSVGLTGELFGMLNFTIDAYQIDIDDRIVFSSQYSRERVGGVPTPDGQVNQILNEFDSAATINSVQFFTNAISTRTKGLDIVLSDRLRVGKGSLLLTAASNLNETKVREIHGPDVIENNPAFKPRLFDRLERSRYESSVPKSKITLSANYSIGKLGFLLRTVRFGEVTYLHPIDPTIPSNNLPLEIDQTFSAKWITDISVSYKVIDKLNLTLGANNLFDIYPDKTYIDPRNNQFNLSGDPATNYTAARDNTSNGHFMYNRNATQFGFNGRYVFARLTFQM